LFIGSEAEGSAVRHSCAPHLSFYNQFLVCHPACPGAPWEDLQLT
jgi:hypothetical protein